MRTASTTRMQGRHCKSSSRKLQGLRRTLDSTRHDMIFHWVVFVAGFIVAVAGGVSKTLDTLQWGWDNTVLANISVAWVIINMVPFGMALGYAYLPHKKNVHGLLVSLSWTAYAMCVLLCVGAML